MKIEYREFTDKELKWLRSFERIMKKAPDTLFMFVGAGFTIYAKDENNNRYMADNGAVDCLANSLSIATEMECDGGDY